MEKLQLSVLYDISKTLTSSTNIHDNIEYIVNLLISYLGYDHVFVNVVNPITNELENFGGIDLSYKKGEGITGKVWQHGVPIVIPDISKEKQFLNKLKRNLKNRQKKVSFIAVPIKIKDKVIGVLAVDKSLSDRESLNVHTEFLTMVANILGGYLKLYLDFEEAKRRIEEEKNRLQSRLDAIISKTEIEGLVVKSEKVLELIDIVKNVANTPATVLLTGESGVGKEVFAKAIHQLSNRAKKPFIKINCAAIPEDLLESELFGYEKGAFTGANTVKKGKFELANGGTIFLDEIGDMPLSLQSKILRVIQEKEVERLGGSKPIKIDVRIIAATNKNLEKMVYEGTFREDLYYRLNVIPIHIPPLRERKEDIPVLIYFFLDKFNKMYGKNLTISKDLVELLSEYDWPGNVRQLQNTIERMVILAKSEKLDFNDLPVDIKNKIVNVKDKKNSSQNDEKISITTSQLPKTVQEIEKEAIEKALKKSGYVVKKAAKVLGMTPRQVRYRMEKYNIPFKR